MFLHSLILVCVSCVAVTAASFALPDRSRHESLLQKVADHLRESPDSVDLFLDTYPSDPDAEAELRRSVKQDGLCQLCQVVLFVVAAVADDKSWEEVRDASVQGCTIFLQRNGDYGNGGAEEMCDGLMDLQGPHLWAVLQSLDSALLNGIPSRRAMCENVNACFRDPVCPDDIGSGDGDETSRDSARHAQDMSSMLIGRGRAMADSSRRMLNPKHRRSADNLYRVAQLTDIHIDPKYNEGSATDCNMYVCCRDGYYGEGSAGEWGDYKCNTPQQTVELFMEEVNKLDPRPDLIIYSGDSPPHAMWEETYHGQFACSQKIVEVMNNTFDFDVRVLPTFGNHEMYPCNIYYTELDDVKELTSDLTDLWTEIAGFGSQEVTTMKTGGYYSTDVDNNLKVISFNANYWYIFNFYNTWLDEEENSESDIMFNWLRGELQSAKDSEQQVILIGHHPPGNSDAIAFITQCFNDVMTEFSDVIKLYVAGHTHQDEIRIFQDDGEPQVVVHVSPAVTSKSTINPSMRVYEMDRETNNLMDYVQYRFDLAEAIAEGSEPVIKQVYRASTEYDMPDLSPASWQHTVDRMKVDDELFDRQYAHSHTEARNSTCDADCRVSHICHLENANYDDIIDCINEHDGGYTEPDLPVQSTVPPSEITSKASRAGATALSCVLAVIILDFQVYAIKYFVSIY